jgi:hypothetical protein
VHGISNPNVQFEEAMMSSRGKKKTTMAKLSRESRLRERRAEKAARKEARRNAPPAPADLDERAAAEPPVSPESVTPEA